MTLKVNKPRQAPQLKDDVIAIKRLLLTSDGKQLNPDAKVLIRTLMRTSRMMVHSDQIPSDKIERFIGQRDIVVTILDTVFSDLQYYDELIMMSLDNDNNNEE